ncbi:uncharacterized protein PAC_15479 [Phialocephala subalpina]|uniref:RING zinc finger-like domain-containing protein n=1 Tax=Phialocephala subalpina TaxID=576137 RepID=A0A1L7XKL1_9HELO|nr:uncharacterized protein PAC_15479 [Phialocephala subalpina]
MPVRPESMRSKQPARTDHNSGKVGTRAMGPARPDNSTISSENRYQRIGPPDQLKDPDVQSPMSVTSKFDLRDLRLGPSHQLDYEWKGFNSPLERKKVQSEILSPFIVSGHHKFNSNDTAGLTSDMPQELPDASFGGWRQLVEDARIANKELDGREPHTQVLKTIENQVAAASFCEALLPTRQPSEIEIRTTRLYYITECSEENTLREAEADANLALEHWISGLPCVSPSEGSQFHCASCESRTQMTRSYACTQCLRGICQICVTRLMAKKWTRRRCPWCSADGAQFKPNHYEPADKSLCFTGLLANK